MQTLKWWLTGLLILSCCMALNAKEVTLTSMSYPPFYGEKLENNGPLIEVIVQSFKNAGYKTRIIFAPWKRAITIARQGKTADGMVGVWHNKERANDFLYSDPIFPNKVGFYKHKSNAIIFENYTDLVSKGYKLGSVRGYIFPKGLKESGIEIELVTDDLQNLKKLALGRVDLVVVDKDYARFILTDNPQVAKEIEWMGPILAEFQQHLIISRKTPNALKTISDFNKGLRILQQTGDFKKIFKKHGLRL